MSVQKIQALIDRVEARGPYLDDGPILLEALKLAIRHGDMPDQKLQFFVQHGLEVWQDKQKAANSGY
jgi:hypothetical protein